MKYISGVYDRTALDVANRTAKAFFNLADWQRVYNNAQVVKILVDYLNGIDLVFDTVTAPSIMTIVSVADLNKLLANIERIRLACGLPEIEGLVEIAADWEAGVGEPAPDYLTVNDWEKVLEIMESMVFNAAEYQIYCGVCAAGQVRYYQHRFRQYQVVPLAMVERRPRVNVGDCGTGYQRQFGYRRYT